MITARDPGARARRENMLRRLNSNLAEYLRHSDGFRVVRRPATPGLTDMWRKLLDGFVAAGVMRRSRTGRYWWAKGVN